MGVVFLMPFIGRWKLGHWFNLGWIGALMAGVGLLTYLAVSEDRRNPDYLAAVEQADRDAARVKALAGAPTGIPVAGAVQLLRTDPKTMGPKLFARNCASCHRYDGHDGTGVAAIDPQSAPDLKGVGSRAWLEGLLDPDRIATTNYFGGTKFANGKMARFVTRDVADFSPEQRDQLSRVIVALSAEAGLKSQSDLDARDAAVIESGRAWMDSEDMRCTECHEFRKENEDASAPVLTGWGGRDWLAGIIANPAHARFYGTRNDRMPAFEQEKILSPEAITLIVDWLRGDWYDPAAPEAAP
jgi:ubiquinol-cytochrome c reductase cytochrome b subunit